MKPWAGAKPKNGVNDVIVYRIVPRVGLYVAPSFPRVTVAVFPQEDLVILFHRSPFSRAVARIH